MYLKKNKGFYFYLILQAQILTLVGMEKRREAQGESIFDV